MLKITENPSTAYHPLSDGQTERTNQEVEQYLHIYTNYKQSDCTEWLVIAEFALNNCEHAATKMSPFFVDYGFNPHLDVMHTREPVNQQAGEFREALVKVHKQVLTNLKKAAQYMKKFYDRKWEDVVEYKKGDKV